MYIKDTTDRICRILQKHNIETVFTTNRKLGDALRNYKDRIPLEELGVYEIPCGNCEQQKQPASAAPSVNQKRSRRR